MHKCRWNAIKLHLIIQPRAPLLIKSGMASPNPSLPDMQFVRTVTSEGETVYIPGSSLKGTFRSFTEKVLRTISGNLACEPFPNNENYCGKKPVKDDKGNSISEDDDGYPSAVYAQSCYACKIYGNTRLKGRLSFTDAFPIGEVKTETRYGVAISRLSNAVAAGPFDMEVLVQGIFRTSLVLENFEIWQLGLLALTIQAINEGLLKIGFGKNRGFGEVSVTVEQAIVEMVKKPDISKNTIYGIGALVSENELRAYKLLGNDLLEGLREAEETDVAIFVRRTYDPEGWKSITEKAIDHLKLMWGTK